MSADGESSRFFFFFFSLVNLSKLSLTLSSTFVRTQSSCAAMVHVHLKSLHIVGLLRKYMKHCSSFEHSVNSTCSLCCCLYYLRKRNIGLCGLCSCQVLYFSGSRSPSVSECVRFCTHSVLELTSWFCKLSAVLRLSCFKLYLLTPLGVNYIYVGNYALMLKVKHCVVYNMPKHIACSHGRLHFKYGCWL